MEYSRFKVRKKNQRLDDNKINIDHASVRYQGRGRREYSLYIWIVFDLCMKMEKKKDSMQSKFFLRCCMIHFRVHFFSRAAEKEMKDT